MKDKRISRNEVVRIIKEELEIIPRFRRDLLKRIMEL